MRDIFDFRIAKQLGKVAKKTLSYVLSAWLFAQFLGHRRDLGPGEPAWDDSIEVREIGINIQCQTMVSNTAPHGHAERGNLPIFDPDTAIRRSPPAIKTEVS